MGRSNNNDYNRQATQTNQQVVQTAQKIETPYSDAMRPLAQGRVTDILNGVDSGEVLHGLMPVSEEQLLMERDAKRGPDGMFALAAPNDNYVADREMETRSNMAASRARGMSEARMKGLEFFNTMGFASEGRGVDALATKGSLLSGATGNYLQQQQQHQNRRRWFDPLLGGMMAGASMMV